MLHTQFSLYFHTLIKIRRSVKLLGQSRGRSLRFVNAPGSKERWRFGRDYSPRFAGKKKVSAARSSILRSRDNYGLPDRVLRPDLIGTGRKTRGGRERMNEITCHLGQRILYGRPICRLRGRLLARKFKDAKFRSPCPVLDRYRESGIDRSRVTRSSLSRCLPRTCCPAFSE